MVVILAAAAAAAVTMFVVDEALLEQMVGVVQTAVVMSLVMLVKLYRTDHVHARPFILVSCKSQQTHSSHNNCVAVRLIFFSAVHAQKKRQTKQQGELKQPF